MTSNIWGLPWPLSIKKKERFSLLVQIVQKEQPDIVGLQEVWLTKDVRRLQRALPEYHVVSHAGQFANMSGLVTLSRTPCTKIRFTEFPGPWFHKEFPARKGCIACDTKKDGLMFTIINTHMCFSGQDEVSRVQKIQLATLGERLPTTPTILLGDFNIPPSRLSLDTYYFISNISQPTIEKTNPYSRYLFNRISSKSGTPDSILINFPITTSKGDQITSPYISDHYPAVTKITIP